MKNLVNFPIESDNIWCLAYGNNALSKNTEAPFTEKEFTQTYKNIFSSEFTDRLLKIKSKELFEKGSFETQSLAKEGFSVKIYATYDKKEQELRIHLNFTYLFDDGEELSTTESGEMFDFKLINNKLQLVEVWMAG